MIFFSSFTLLVFTQSTLAAVIFFFCPYTRLPHVQVNLQLDLIKKCFGNQIERRSSLLNFTILIFTTQISVQAAVLQNVNKAEFFHQSCCLSLRT